MEKKCSKCCEVKLFSEFNRHKGRSDGHNNRCSSCTKIDKKIAYHLNKEKILKQQKTYRENNKGACRKRSKEYYENNRDKLLEYHKEYSKTDVNKKTHSNASKKYRKTEKGKVVNKKSHDKYCRNNKEKRKAKQSVYNAIRRGNIFRPNVCSTCGIESNKIEGHHWSYLKEHWLDVVWCCKQCHVDIHNDNLIIQ